MAVEQRDSEAIHVLKGAGEFRAWPKNVPPEFPVQAPLRPQHLVVGEIEPSRAVKSMKGGGTVLIQNARH